MDAEIFRLVFLAVFGLGIVLHFVLTTLNQREVLRHPGLPPFFAGRMDPETYARSREYTLEQQAFAKASLLYSALVTLVLLFSGLLPWAWRALEWAFAGGLNRGVAFLAGVLFLQAVLRLPLSLYATFRIEGKYGFNTMTWGLFWKDLAKESLLSILLGIPFLYAVLALLDRAGPRGWLWAYAFILAFQVILVVVYPLFIAPLFNRFKPLGEGELKASLLGLAGALGFPARGIYVMDGSRRSLHSNAYFTGLGRLRRIVLFDTLLRQMETPELRGILAHEIGHYKLKHVYKLLISQVVLLGGLLFLLSRALAWEPLYRAFGFSAAVPAVGLFLFFTVFSSLDIAWAPLRNFLSRRHEYQADAFAVKALGDPRAMQSALIKLSLENLSNLTPHPWFSAFHYSHPTLAERLRAIDALDLRGNPRVISG